MQITFIRGEGKKQGPDVIDELLTDERAGVARGKREANYYSTDRMMEDGSCPKHDFIETGLLTGITETRGRWVGKISTYMLTLTVDANRRWFAADTGLEIEREVK